MCNRLKDLTIAIIWINFPNRLQLLLFLADWIDCISINSLLYMTDMFLQHFTSFRLWSIFGLSTLKTKRTSLKLLLMTKQLNYIHSWFVFYYLFLISINLFHYNRFLKLFLIIGYDYDCFTAKKNQIDYEYDWKSIT